MTRDQWWMTGIIALICIAGLQLSVYGSFIAVMTYILICGVTALIVAATYTKRMTERRRDLQNHFIIGVAMSVLLTLLFRLFA